MLAKLILTLNPRNVCSLMQMDNFHSFSCLLSPRAPLPPDSLCWGREWQLEGAVLPTFPLLSPGLSPALFLDLRALHSYFAQGNIWPLAISDLTWLSQRPVWSESCQHSGLTQGHLSTSSQSSSFPETSDILHISSQPHPPSVSRAKQRWLGVVWILYEKNPKQNRKTAWAYFLPHEALRFPCYPFLFLQGN